MVGTILRMTMAFYATYSVGPARRRCVVATDWVSIVQMAEISGKNLLRGMDRWD